MSIKDELDEMYGVTEEEINKIILEQKIEDEEKKISILKELVRYRSFEEYVADHKKEFEEIDIGDDFKSITINWKIYPNINIDIIKKIGIVAQYFGVLIFVLHKEKKEKKEKKVIYKKRDK